MHLLVCIPNWRQKGYLQTNSAGVYFKGTACHGHNILYPAALHTVSVWFTSPSSPTSLSFSQLVALWRELIATPNTLITLVLELVWSIYGWAEGAKNERASSASVYFTYHSRGFSRGWLFWLATSSLQHVALMSDEDHMLTLTVRGKKCHRYIQVLPYWKQPPLHPHYAYSIGLYTVLHQIAKRFIFFTLENINMILCWNKTKCSANNTGQGPQVQHLVQYKQPFLIQKKSTISELVFLLGNIWAEEILKDIWC